MEWKRGSGGDLRLEKTVHFQRGADHSHKKCPGQYANLPNVYLPKTQWRARIKENSHSELEPCWASGFGGLHVKGITFGNNDLYQIRARGIMGGGLRRAPKSNFGKTDGALILHCPNVFNHLFVLAVHRDASIEEMWDHHSGQGDWNLIFERDFNDWELDMVGDLLRTLRGHRPSLEDDSIKWRQGRNVSFRVKEAYRLLDKSNASLFPARGIWVDRVPTKVSFFAWEATWGKVLTLDKLQIRGVQLPNCCFCVVVQKRM
ncbi:hypothetical protein CK203_014322 [Vitis vinifera]|uniref:Reverse transcriptase zinc-binding domain-containing protein n=1 Tax=Vitis vinifera TaxID=29760 RepID=A0A438K517_VITVI|nr:hypothetical protein CK203_014322 [Vitis vinifera]